MCLSLRPSVPSGTGVLAKRADMRWRRRPEELQQLVGLQDELLDAAAPLVRPGGVLVYSTCSLEPEECSERVVAFLERHPEFALSPAGGGSMAQGTGISGTYGVSVSEGLLPRSVVTREGFVATYPHVHGCDGAFAARMVKHAGS